MAAPTTEPHGTSLAVVEGVLERITFANEETGYTVARVDTGHGAGDLLTVVGALLGAQPGESLRMRGRWGSHPQYGRQFTVENYTTVLPATVAGIQKYLGSGLIKGIGPKTAEKIVGHFGVQTLAVIEEAPQRLIEVPTLGPKRTKLIAAAWIEQKAIKEVMVFLQSVGVTTSISVRIYKEYGDAAIDVVKQEPYKLASDVWGIGFKTADSIAVAVGIPHDSPERVKAGIQYALSQGSDAGNCYLPRQKLLEESVKILTVPLELASACLDQLIEAEGVVAEDIPDPDGYDPDEPIRAVYLVPFHRAEVSLAAQLRRLLEAPDDRLGSFASVDWDKALTWLKERTGADLAPEQTEAVRQALTSKVSVLTGGPGCGKSFTVRSIVELARAKRARVVLAAPTGKAAKRLAELTGAEAMTVHRLLELKPGGDAAFDRDRPLEADLVVVDEASMLDVLLANKLAKAVAPGSHLLLVGDVDQLPSVGAGEVLRDLLAAPRVPRVRLTQVFRQAQQSGVVVNAHRINSGKPLRLEGFNDFFLFVEDETEDAARVAVELATTRIPKRFGFDPRRDIQVLTPMHRGPAGAGTLNGLLQETLTPAQPSRPEKRFGGRTFRVGDKVTQIRNNYDKGSNGVFNGTGGVITSMVLEDQTLVVRTDEDEEVPYDFAELDELQHAYAMTVHRSQGSEYPVVVVPVTMSAWMMLQRNLLYTAVTRAKKLVVLVGSKRALAQAVRTVSAGKRFTGLDHRLR
ncbi:ATP-dependent RecD-like DNA helicase [Catenulispora sp. NL8]|uniref:ATP-dependent RecD2 DNA helicase n=1 Tax=Catenulispora pinistramenti TaxID=2705254 RepID=A0ABS5L5X4_9ACTN|nr:ATP-dependent RecD-like DNA helicase [Catenulispora pinistramenti]MBS2553751.1 ATP-dependent RecD-like DNA helicase [Catenulispora pinistramenti]